MSRVDIDKLCVTCGKSFSKPLNYSPSRWSQRKNCSIKCQRLASLKQVEANCSFCNKKFWMHFYRIKIYKKHFCSRQCKNKDSDSKLLFKKNPKPFEKGLRPWNKGVPINEQTKLKIKKSLKGKRKGSSNPAWKGGVVSENKKIRNSSEYADWRKLVFRRDNYTCQICKSRGVELNADHIKSFSQYPDLRLDINNGRTLCIPCHKETDNYGFKATNSTN